MTERLPCIRDAVPEAWIQDWHALERSTFDITLPNIAQRLQRGTRDDILEITRHHLFVERELDEY